MVNKGTVKVRMNTGISVKIKVTQKKRTRIMHRLDSDELRLGKNFIEGSDYRRRRKTDRLI